MVLNGQDKASALQKHAMKMFISHKKNIDFDLILHFLKI